MYSTRFFIISAVLFILQAIPSTTSRGIAIPFIKREAPSLDELANGIERPVAKRRTGMTTSQMNTDDNKTLAKRAVPGAPLMPDIKILPHSMIGRYFLPIQIRGNEYLMALETVIGGDITLASSTCRDRNCQGHTLYTQREGDSSLGPFVSRYIRYIMSGERYAESVVIPGTAEEIEATDQIVLAANSYPPELAKKNFKPDGIIGMGPPKSTKFGVPFLVTLHNEDQETVPKPMLCLKLGGEEPMAHFGAPDPSITEGEIIWINFSKETIFWELHLEKIEMKNQNDESLAWVLVDQLAILDFGQPMVTGESTAIIRFIEKIPGFQWINRPTGFAAAPCHSEIDFEFIVNGHVMIIAFQDLVVSHLPGDPSFCIIGLGVDPKSPPGSWSFGYAFVLGFYALFDYNSNRPRFGFVSIHE